MEDTKTVNHAGIKPDVEEGNGESLDMSGDEEANSSGLFGWWGYRHTITVISFLALAVAYAQRVNLSLGIVAMTDRNSTQETGSEYFDWDSDKSNTILSSFFWGYVITQIPAGQIAERFGPKFVLSVGIGLCSFLTLLSPVAASAGWEWLCVCRVIQGLGQGVLFPSMHALLGRWSPPKERGRISTFVYAGAQFGTVVAMPLCGLLASTKGAGWPSIFYLFGGLGLCWTIIWILFGSSGPDEHRWISAKERDYILNSIGEQRQRGADTAKHLPTPWKAIMTSVPFWAILVAHCGQNWGYWTLLTEMPTYMSSVLNFDIKKNGNLSAVPYLVMWIFSIFISWCSDKALERKWFSIGVARKIGNSIAHWGPGLALIGLGFVPENEPMLALGLLILSVGFNGASFVGFQVNHIDLAPNFAGTLMGITNCVANIMSILAPIIAGKIAPDHGSVDQWRIVFFVAAAVYFVFNLFFIIFGSGEIQPWNNPGSNQVEKSSEEQSKEKEKASKDHLDRSETENKL